jgi:hypothetical protein
MVASLVRIDQAEVQGTAVTLYEIESGKISLLVQTSNEKFVITRIAWANNAQLLLSATFPAVRYRTKTTETRLLKIDINTRELKLAIARSVFQRNGYIPQFQDSIVDALMDEPNSLLISLRMKNSSVNRQVLRLNLNNGRLKVVQGQKDHIVDWIADRQHRVRIGIYHNDTTHRVLLRDIDGKNWRKLW